MPDKTSRVTIILEALKDYWLTFTVSSSASVLPHITQHPLLGTTWLPLLPVTSHTAVLLPVAAGRSRAAMGLIAARLPGAKRQYKPHWHISWPQSNRYTLCLPIWEAAATCGILLHALSFSEKVKDWYYFDSEWYSGVFLANLLIKDTGDTPLSPVLA